MSNILLVPIHLDALHLKNDQSVVEAMANFSRLPYSDGQRDFNSDIAYISEEIVPPPFQNENLHLKAGLHLHWSLPDALTKGLPDPTGLPIFPAVPNRWLITRRRGDNVEKQWVVESDYLYPAGSGGGIGSVNIPHKADSSAQPFRYLGRKMPLAAWPPDDQADYLDKLTAVGYGEPAFAAFYPNCHSVFGFYDDDYTNNIPSDLQYDVWGWYSNPAQDYLGAFVSNFRTNQGPETSNDDLLAALQEEFEWTLAIAAEQAFPEQMLCYARMTFTTGSPTENSARNTPVTLAVGNTSTEALAAYLGHEIAGRNSSQKPIIEDQLEAVQLAGRFEHQQLDIGPKFKESRHESGFATFSAGQLWTIRPETPADTPADAGDTQTKSQVTLPESMAHQLNDLNALQQAYNQALYQIESMRRQLFSDWYKYMLAAYPPDDSRDAYPDLDEVKHYLEVKGILPLQAKLAGTGTLMLQADGLGRIRAASMAAEDQANCLADRVAAALNELVPALAAYNIDLALLAVSDITDWPAFGSKFKPDQPLPPHLKWILTLLPAEAQTLLDRESETNDLPDADKLNLINALNQLLQNPDFYQAGAFAGVTLSGEAQALLAIDLANWSQQDRVRLNRLLLEASFPQEIAKARTSYRLKQTTGPRYWQPNEPVISLIGQAVQPSDRFGQDGRLRADGFLECQLLTDAVVQDLIPADLSRIMNKIDDISQTVKDDHIAFRAGSQQPWHPFLLEWEVEVFPARSQSNLQPGTREYGVDFILQNYTLAENEPDFSMGRDQQRLIKAANVYQGRSILTPHAGIQLKTRLEAYFKKHLLPAYDQAQPIPEAEQTDDYFEQNVSTILDWYKQTSCQGDPDPICNLITAYERLTDRNFHTLSQALGGFNNALLMHRETMQLNIADPLGFADYQTFAQDVRDAVKNSTYSAPEPLNDFNPIRSGAFKLLRVRLIDSFGQVRELDPGQTIFAGPMTLAGNNTLAALPPRLVQPARLNFRWLSAGQGEQEMNDHPATTPICGWILPNHLDSSLMIYDNQGRALGSITINPDEPWQPSPGSEAPIAIEGIVNPHLKKVVRYIRDRQVASLEQAQAQSFLQNFITALDRALENIEPENFAQHQDLALLMGRPIALVRASLNLELQGLPAIQHGWHAFRQDMKRNTRETDNFTHVEFPIRLSEYKQLNDGLVGYWREDNSQGDEGNWFYAPQSDEIQDDYIKSHADDPLTILQTLESPPQILAMLVDPRGKVHATSGILPTKAIDIPPDQYMAALQAIEITFLSTPILSDLGRINLPLPAEPGYQWSWLARENGGWSEVAYVGLVKKQTFVTAFENGEDIWTRLLEKGWLVAIDSSKARVAARDERGETTLGDDLQSQVAAIENVLAQAHLGPVNLRATFAKPQEIREGWLKLKKPEEAQTNNGT